MKLAIAASIVLALAACASPSQPEPRHNNALFQQLGGKIGLDQLVITTLQLVRKDERIGFLFEDIDAANLSEQLYDQLCYLSGGPCAYEGLDMRDAHAGMAITKAEFDIFVDLFIRAMEKNHVPFAAQNRMLALLTPMRKDIIHQ